MHQTTGVGIAVEDEQHLVDGLVEGTTYYFGTTIDLGSGRESIGPTLRARCGSPVHVRPGAAAGGDGTAGAPFNSLWPGVLTAFAQGGGNVWVAGGILPGTSIGLLDGVDLYGGFPANFSLEARSPEDTPTRLRAGAGSAVIALEASDIPATIDGFSIDGLGAAAAGLDVDSHPLELRQVSVGNCARGVKLRSLPTGDEVEVALLRCTMSSNDVGGLSVDGAFHLLLEDTAFVHNGQEGIDMDDLFAPSGGRARLIVKDCVFADNGADGLDVDLGAPSTTGAGGLFRVRIEDTEFLRNGGDGLLVDHDFETSPNWTAEIFVRGCVARGNKGNGMRLDLDAAGYAHIHRSRADGNLGDGFLVSSESRAGTSVVSSSAAIGNRGYGVRGFFGNYAVVVSHSVLAGNGLGGYEAGPGGGGLVSSIAYQQPSPWDPNLATHCVIASDAGTFERIASGYLAVTSANGNLLTLAAPAPFGTGTTLELDEDGGQRSASVVNGTQVRVLPAPVNGPPTVLSWFNTAGQVQEDWTIPSGSTAKGQGMPRPGGGPVDAGPLSAPSGGAPGFEDLVPPEWFAFSGSSPAWNKPLAANADLLLSFDGGPVDSASLNTGIDATDDAGNPLPIDPSVQGEGIRVPAPPGGWPAGARIRLHGTLRSGSGQPLSAPAVLTINS